jgi:hypothetical protein
MKTTSDYKIVNIVGEFKKLSIKDKDTFFNLLLRLKQSLEFNSNIDWQQLYAEMSVIYKNYRPFYVSGKYTQDPIDIEKFPSNGIFVFGSNNEGQHIGGAARFAVDNYGAIVGQAEGLQGSSYAIPTLQFAEDNNLYRIPLEDIKTSIETFINFALDHPELEFHVTKIGCGIAGFEIKEIASLFKGMLIPENVVLPNEFINPQLYEEYLYNPDRKKFFHIKNPNHVVVVSVDEEDLCIRDIKMEDVVSHLGPECVVCEKDDYVLASEQVIKKLYAK